MGDDVHGTVWPDWQVDLIVAGYFDMLADEIPGRSYNKAEHNRALQELTGRNHAPIEFKHCNISAVLEQLGIRGIRGYRARPNFQNALIDGIERYLTSKGQPLLQFVATAPEFLAEAQTLWIGPPPEVTREEQTPPERLRLLVRRFDPAERDARNRRLGKQG